MEETTMNCPYCGREVKDGEVFCECGRPVNLSGAAAGSSPQPAVSSGGTSSPYLPEGVSLESLHKPARSSPPIWLVAIVLLACVGVILFFMFKNGDITKESSWKTVERPEYTVKVPSALKDEKKRMISIGADLLDFFSGKEAAILINKKDWTSSQKEMIKQLGKEATKEQIYNLFTKRWVTVNGVKTELTPKMKGDYIYFETETVKKNYIDKTDDLFEIEAYFVTDDSIYEVDVFCAKSDESKYKDTLYKLLDNFKLK